MLAEVCDGWSDHGFYWGWADLACQMSSSVSARVKATGPMMMPVMPKRATPPMMEMRTVAVWARMREPTRMG